MRETFDSWLRANPTALNHLDVWLNARADAADDRGIRKVLDQLRRLYGCPFRSQPGLLNWLREHRAEVWARAADASREGITSATETVKAKPAAKPALAEIRFSRSRAEVEAIEAHGTYIVTCAQNNTEPEWDFLAALKVYAEERRARLIVIPIRYKNPTSRRDPQDATDRGYWWHDAFQEHLVEDELRVHSMLRIQADVSIQATAPQPLSTLDSRSQDASAVYGHPQLQMRTVATPHRLLPKLLYTTGAVTRKNYSRTKAGNLATFHHSHAAVVIEVRGESFHLREVCWSSGNRNFTDLDRVYTPEGSHPAPPVRALVTGDEHAWFHSPEVRQATYEGPESIVAVLKPETIVRHDVLDGYSISPWHGKKSLTRAAKARSGRDSLQRELDDCIRFIEATTPPGGRNVIVPSNHHDFLTRWLQAGETAVDPLNAALYHWLKWRVLSEAEDGPNGVTHPDPFELYASDKILVDARFLKLDEPFQVEDIELGMHGHLGPNGARGSVKNLSTIGARSIIGHVHSPGIYQGVYAVGTSSNLRLDYNPGPSGWLNTHAVVHANGKRQMIHVIRGRWRG